MSATIKDVKAITAAALGLRAALLTMRSFVGPKSASQCEREAERLLGELGHKRLVSAKDLQRAEQELRHSNETLTFQRQAQAILRDRTLQLSEIYQQIVALGRPDSPTTYLRLREQLSKHCNGRGEQLFVRVKQGWYRCARHGEVANGTFEKLPRGLLLRVAYDVMHTDTLNAVDILERIIASGEISANHLRVMSVAQILVQNAEFGANCFERRARGCYKRIEGRRPPVETPVSVILDAMCIILRNGQPLASDSVRLCLAERGHTLNTQRTTEILRANSGTKGRRLFERMHKGVYRLAVPAPIERIVDVLTSGEVLSPARIAKRVGELGYSFPINVIRVTLAKYAGFGLPLRRVGRGLYAKNITPLPGTKT